MQALTDAVYSISDELETVPRARIRYEPRKDSKVQWCKTFHQVIARVGKKAKTFRIAFAPDCSGDSSQFLACLRSQWQEAAQWARSVADTP